MEVTNRQECGSHDDSCPLIAESIRHIERFREPILSIVLKNVQLSGVVLELGAGTSWMGSIVSRQQRVCNVIECDISTERLALAKRIFIPYFKGDQTKISFFYSDFQNLRPTLQPHSCDFVIVDAALHHATNLPLCLAEIKRVLKENGRLIAIREPILISFPVLRLWRKWSFGWKQRMLGDVENIYPMAEWMAAFENAGLSLDAQPYFLNCSLKERVVRFLGIHFNGVLFSRYYFVAAPSTSER